MSYLVLDRREEKENPEMWMYGSCRGAFLGRRRNVPTRGSLLVMFITAGPPTSPS